MPIRLWAVLALGLSVFLSGLDGSIANVALPNIARTLQITPVDAIWLVNAYQLSLVAGILCSSALGEIYGYRVLFISGTFLFTLSSFACAVAPSWDILIAARVAQGLGGAGIIGVSNALLRYTFPQSMLGRGFGIYALIASSSSAMGPSIASAILAVAPWPWLFGVNVPLGIIAITAALKSLPPSDRTARPFDIRGAILTATAVALLLLGVDGLAHHNSPIAVILELLGSALAAIWLVRVESRVPDPLMPLDLLHIPVFGISVVISLGLYSTQFLAFVSLPFYFLNNLGLTQAQTGLLMTPWPLIMAVSAPFCGWLADRYSPGILCGTGMLLCAFGLVLVLLLPAHPSMGNILWRMVVCGCGWALVVPPNSRAMMGSSPMRRVGAASGITAASRNLGQTLGAAMVAVSFGMFPTHSTTVCLLAGIGLGSAAALLSFHRHALTVRHPPDTSLV